MVIQGLSGIDIALWDLKGKRFGVPAHRLMGGPLRTEVRAYATGLYRRRTGDPVEYLAEEAAGYAARGVRRREAQGRLRRRGGRRASRAPCGRRSGRTSALMVDANHAYDAVAAIRLGRRIEELDIGWFEEPVPPEDLAGYREVKAALAIPVAGGECEFTRFGFRELLTSRAVDIVQPDTCAAGGLSECKKIADMAAAFGVRYNPHVWGTGVALAAALQLLAVLPSHTPASLAPVEPMLEFDRTEHPIRQALLRQPIEHDGRRRQGARRPRPRDRGRPRRPGPVRGPARVRPRRRDGPPEGSRRSPRRRPPPGGHHHPERPDQRPALRHRRGAAPDVPPAQPGLFTGPYGMGDAQALQPRPATAIRSSAGHDQAERDVNR